ncbi:MAG: NAD(P)-binding domain-containing protein [Akkermansiaceae bacterium]|nr:NAD(P)-binding domain-containing protein [Akkermansiaceae bacterium]MCF7730040.1 NAD(P)-binding domain-containing protein [Akkermansiaceae bacterium]
MISPTIGFIGGGRITRIFLEGWSRAGQMPPDVIVSDPDANVLDVLKSHFPEVLTTPDNAVAARQDLVFLAVHPPLIAEVTAGLRNHLMPETIMVSLAPKFTIARLTELLGGFARLARFIPNAPSILGAGFNPVAFGSALGGPEKAQLTNLFASLGKFPEVAEEKLEAYAVVTAMGPTYFWFQLQLLRELAAGFGLDDLETTSALASMVSGATQTLLESGLSPAEVMDLIPVKPLAAMEPQVAEAYRTTLPAIYQKIKP